MAPDVGLPILEDEDIEEIDLEDIEEIGDAEESGSFDIDFSEDAAHAFNIYSTEDDPDSKS